MELEHAFDASITLAPVKDLGDTPVGHRRIIDITGGTVSGPKLQGKILPGGADWQYIRGDNVTYLDARYTIETADGALIYVSNQGYRHGPPEIIEKLIKGEPVEDSSYYFRCTPWFETSAPQYDWLNRTIFVGTGGRDPDAVRLSVFEVT
ncbi:MAG: DUF3237 domain-containing protein [Rhodospirillaceae bacterium]|jgi:hypothetical protein|nr:DUF3237 domain-containing protein [Rhodospirillaceae bacterium]